MKERLVFYVKALFFLPGTLLHELSHFLVAKIIGAKVVGFSLYPRIIRDSEGRVISFEYGKVEFLPQIKALNFLIGLSPLLLWVLLYQILCELNIIYGFSLKNYTSLIDPSHILLWYMAIVLIISGKPSIVDLRMSLFGFFSASGLLLVCLLCICVYGYYSDFAIQDAGFLVRQLINVATASTR